MILAAGINVFTSQEGREGREREPLQSLKWELEQYRKAHGDQAKREDLVKIWKSYEGKLSPNDMEKLKQDYRAKLDPAEGERLQKAYEEMKGKSP